MNSTGDRAQEPGETSAATLTSSDSANPPAPAPRTAIAFLPEPPAREEAGADVVGPGPQPSWWSLIIAVGAALAFFAIALFSFDWGDAAQHGAGLATVMGVLCLLTGLLYLLAGARPHWLTWLVVGALFALLGLYELPAAVVPLHLLQASEAVTAGRFDQAYTEWRLAGVPPCDPRVTGALLGWAGTDQRHSHYGDAIERLRTLERDCPQSQSAEAARSQIGRTELAWGEQLLSTGDYAGAITVLAAVQRDYAATPLAPAARLDSAAAYAAWADTEEHAGRYASALAKYQTILGTYPDSPYAVAARTGAAQTLFDWGQWDTHNARYDEAVLHYHQLVDLYPGTPQADQAAALLVAPQMVVGRLMHADGSAASGVGIRLSSEWQFGGGSYTTAGTQFSATTDATGIFTLSAVPPGSYLLEWVGPNGRYTTFVDETGQPIEILTVPRLHTLSVGNVDITPTNPQSP